MARFSEWGKQIIDMVLGFRPMDGRCALFTVRPVAKSRRLKRYKSYVRVRHWHKWRASSIFIFTLPYGNKGLCIFCEVESF